MAQQMLHNVLLYDDNYAEGCQCCEHSELCNAGEYPAKESQWLSPELMCPHCCSGVVHIFRSRG